MENNMNPIQIVLILILSVVILYLINLYQLARYLNKQPDIIKSTPAIMFSILFTPASDLDKTHRIKNSLKYHLNILTGRHLTGYRKFVNMLEDMTEEEYAAFNKSMDDLMIIIGSFAEPVILGPLIQQSTDIDDFDKRKAKMISQLERILESDTKSDSLAGLMLIKINSYAEESGFDVMEIAEQSKMYLTGLDLERIKNKHFLNAP